MNLKFHKGQYVSIYYPGTCIHGKKGHILEYDQAFNAYNVQLENPVDGRKNYLVRVGDLRKESPSIAGVFEF